MIELIFGCYGSGKTREIFSRIERDFKENKKSFLIIPDQEAVQFERQALELLGTRAQLSLEILSFSRLYNRVCREYGGLSYSYVTKPMRSLLMWKTLRELEPLLVEFKTHASDSGMTDLMLTTINEFKASGINPAHLELASKKLPEGSALRMRLYDLALIYACFDNFVSEKYSDSADDLSKLSDVLEKHNFFAGANVYIDSFTSFTSVQHRIIESIFKQADNVSITLPLLSPDDTRISTESITRALTLLRRSAERHGGASEVTLGENKRTSSPTLAYLTKNLWKLDTTVSSNTPNPDGSIICEICSNPYSECEAVAAHIRKLLSEGARARDIVIVMRDPQKYEGIIDSALASAEVPFFFSKKSDLCSMPAIKLILSALRIKRYNWQASDLLSHLKTGLCDIDMHDAYLFEEYVNTWGIHGSRFYEGDWNMNPDGFVPEISERGKEILESANRARAAICEPLLKLFLLLDASDTIADKCRAIYSYICDISLEDKLSTLAQKAAERGDFKQARELSRLYSLILSTLAEVGETIGDEEADDEELSLILKTIFDKTEIGSIPTSIDEVTIGSAAMLRASGQKYAMVIGLCENEFPAAIDDGGMFSSSDRRALADLGIELASDIDSRSSDELMYVERAFSIPSEKLYIFTHRSEIGGGERFPSLAFNRVKKLFPSLTVHNCRSDDIEYLVGAPKNAASVLRIIEDARVRESLRVALEGYVPNIADASKREASESACSVSKETAARALGSTLHLSPSSFEKYVKCPFSYYCSSVLRLRESKIADFRSNDMGTFVHYVLENLIKECIPTDEGQDLADDETIIKMTDEAVERYIKSVCPEYLLNDPKIQHTYRRLRSLSLLLVKSVIEEFSASDFRPSFFELRADGVEANPAPMFFRLDSGTTVSFSGMVDRVDVYSKDGEVYLRVVDYKTGTKQFSLSDVDRGVNLQMLLYLFTLCRNRSKEFKRSIGLSDGKDALPAGVMYLSSNIALIEIDDYINADEVMKRAAEGVERTGVILNEEEILLAMNRELDATFLAGVKKNKDGTLKGDALASADTFADIYERLEKVIVKFASALYSGNADAKPQRYGKSDPCTYCEARPICRNMNQNGGER
ncbi:MAG: exodeoxyribonuclease V subunit gamma [Clostridia bacterium]|nr:exodeoxyribonuclease V subunit gamma [Clostridia bacterium]